VLRRKNRRVRFLAENVFLQAGRNILVETRNLRSAPAHHNYIGIQQIDDLRQTAREAVFEPIEGGKRGRFPGVASRDDLRTLEGNTRRAMVIRFQASSGNPSLNAAFPSAIAGETRKLLGAHPRQSVVPPFTRNAIRTAVQTAIHGDSGTTARSRTLRPLLAQHERHLAQLRARLIQPSGTSPTPTARLSASGATAGPSPARVTVARLRAAERASAADLVQRLATVPPALAQLFASIAASDATHVTVLGG